MLDFNHVTSTPGYDVQYFVGGAAGTLVQWQTWRKPRGVKMVYIIGVGGGSSGGTGINTGATSGGGQGGSSGAQTAVMLPAMFVPDTLYIQPGQGGPGQTTSGNVGVAGQPTYVAIEPGTTLTPNMTLLFANPGAAGAAAATATVGGTVGTAAAVATIANMPLAGRGWYNFFAGQVGTAGAASTANGAPVVPPTTGLMVTGGAGGGGCANVSAGWGGTISNVAGALGQGIFPGLLGGNAAVTTTPAGSGTSYIASNFIMNYGGTGGGGALAGAGNVGGIAGVGGIASPGCGGGGSGGANTNNPAVQGGSGGPGFVYIVSW